MNNRPIKENKVQAADRRKQRQAEALRANLRRRKAEAKPEDQGRENDPGNGEKQG